MTCIIAYIDENGVGHMAGDSAGTSITYHNRQDNVHPKIFTNGEFLIGYTTSFRMGQILEHCFTPPQHPEKTSGYAYMVRHFIPEVRRAFVSSNYMKTDDLHGGSFLIIYRGHLYVVQEDFAVFQRPHSFDAVGSGGAQSIASFATMMDFKLVNEIGICEALFKALEVTSKNNITVSGRFDYINTNGERNER